jgi:hypothetical protein
MRLLKFCDFVNEMKLYEGGNAVEDARPITQAEIDKTYAFVIAIPEPGVNVVLVKVPEPVPISI